MGQSESQRPVKSTQSWFIQRVPHLAAPAFPLPCLAWLICDRPCSRPFSPPTEKNRQASTRSGVTLIEPSQLNRSSTRSTRVAPAPTGWDRIQLSCRSYREISSPSTRPLVFFLFSSPYRPRPATRQPPSGRTLSTVAKPAIQRMPAPTKTVLRQ
jgi:hypothetical protein